MEKDDENRAENDSGEKGPASSVILSSASEGLVKVADNALNTPLKAPADELSRTPSGDRLVDWSFSRASFAATGGATAAIALGVWSGLTLWLTGWTVINALIGLAMGIWALKSPRKRVAWAGIGLNLLVILGSVIWWR
jgi:hypothetical protein